MFEHQKLGPLVQNLKFSHFVFHEFPQNFPTCATHYLINFHILKMIMDFLKISRCPLHFLFWSFFHLQTLSWCKLPWQKVSFYWLLKWLIMYWLISLKWCIFWTWALRYKVVENWVFFKMGFRWGEVDEACERYAWSKFSWLLLRKP